MMIDLKESYSLLQATSGRVLRNVRRTPLLYYGGKVQFASRIVSALDMVPHSLYVEPFCGGAAAFFLKPQTQKQSILSDINPWAVAALRSIQTDPMAFIESLPPQIEHEEYFESVIAVQNNKFTGDDIVDGKHMLVSWLAAFNNNPWTASRSKRACALYKETYDNGVLFARILYAHERLKNDVIIEEIDAIDQIKREAAPDTLIFCDPPYMKVNMGGGSRGLGASGYGPWDASELLHYQLINVIEEGMNKGAQFVLTTGKDSLYEQKLFDLGFVLLDAQNQKSNNPATGGPARATTLLWIHNTIVDKFYAAQQNNLF